MLMLCAIIPGDRTTVHVNMVILETEELAKVSLVISIYLYPFKKMLDGVNYTHFEITGGPCNLIGSN